ncbi:MAG: Glu-tRNA(Gln) amidotransferase subunit GatE [Candidatus Micrarchaeia archaeon]
MKDEHYYKQLGFKCGLEIHQRLDTAEKLFCSCSPRLEEEPLLGNVERRQRAVAGELGKVDWATQFEGSKGRKFVYQVYRSTVCLVDIDEEPPHDLNSEALDIALKIAANLHAHVPDELEVMRKVVIDGSDPSAFQRTLLVGYDGYIEVDGKKISIPSIFLEEESSGIVSSDSGKVVYDVRRLGIPLIEIDTAPEISSPQEAKEAAQAIGLLLRLMGKVQRGIGTIRQDVNVSIAKGARVEIKGFQDLDTMPEIIESEIERQLNLLRIRDSLQERKAAVGKPVDLTDILKSTAVRLIKSSIDAGGIVLGARLKGFKGLLGFEINKNRRLGTEISEYAKLAGIGGIIHSDEDLSHYGFSNEEISLVSKALGVKENDAFILISGPREQCTLAMEFALERASRAIYEVPKETRAADTKNLVTKFLRPLPGGSRMYPETDIRPIAIDRKKLGEYEKGVVSIAKVRSELLKEIENPDLAEQMLWSPLLSLYNEIVGKTGVPGYVVAPILLEKLTELRRQGIDIDSIPNEAMLAVFEEYKANAVTKAGIEELLKRTPKSRADVQRLIRELGLERITGKRLEALLKGFEGKSKEETLREIMSKYRLNVDGNELKALLSMKE